MPPTDRRDRTRQAEPTRYFLSTLPATISIKVLVNTVKMRWRIEHDYRELKQELGLGHYEGRNWHGFHHHASLCIAAYAFLMRERLSGAKKTPLDSKHLPYPGVSARAGRAPMQRHVPWSIASVRFRLARIIARSLSQCPCCGRPRVRELRISDTVQLANPLIGAKKNKCGYPKKRLPGNRSPLRMRALTASS